MRKKLQDSNPRTQTKVLLRDLLKPKIDPKALNLESGYIRSSSSKPRYNYCNSKIKPQITTKPPLNPNVPLGSAIPPSCDFEKTKPMSTMEEATKGIGSTEDNGAEERIGTVAINKWRDLQRKSVPLLLMSSSEDSIRLIKIAN